MKSEVDKSILNEENSTAAQNGSIDVQISFDDQPERNRKWSKNFNGWGWLFLILVLVLAAIWGSEFLKQDWLKNVTLPKDKEEVVVVEPVKVAQPVMLTDVSEMVDTVSPSVVTVSLKTKQLKNGAALNNFNQMEMWNMLFNPGVTPKKQVIEPEYEDVQQDIGTGFVVDGGMVVTNKHVVSAQAQASDYVVIDSQDNEHLVTQIYRDPEHDLAILQVQDLQVSPLSLGNSDELKVGQGVVAVGTALGEFRHTVTTGVVSGLGRTITASDGRGRMSETLTSLIQTDTAINSGNSGGPLLNAQGEAIGVNVAVTQGAQNVGFALPISLVKEMLSNFEETGKFDRPFMGVGYQLISEKAALMNEIPQGVYITQVVEDSAAAEAGLKEEDVITKFGGEGLKEENALSSLINKHKIGDKIEVEYYREGEKHTTTVVLKGQET